jgi:hypothetical protein
MSLTSELESKEKLQNGGRQENEAYEIEVMVYTREQGQRIWLDLLFRDG